MSVGQLKSYLDLNREELCETIREGKYIPQPIRGKEISKRNGKTRLLGIPTVVDRMLQQAVLRVIMPQFEYTFSEYSYGFIHIVLISKVFMRGDLLHRLLSPPPDEPDIPGGSSCNWTISRPWRSRTKGFLTVFLVRNVLRSLN